MGNLGVAYVEILFDGFLSWRQRSVRARLGTFADVDRDASGGATKAELEEQCRRSGMVFVQSRLEELFRHADLDNSGEVDEKEYEILLDEMARVVRERLQFVIALLSALLLVLGNTYWWRPSDWQPVDGFYYAMITYMTIGLGDYVWPMTTADSLYGDVIGWTFIVTSAVGVVAMVISSGGVLVDDVRVVCRYHSRGRLQKLGQSLCCHAAVEAREAAAREAAAREAAARAGRRPPSRQSLARLASLSSCRSYRPSASLSAGVPVEPAPMALPPLEQMELGLEAVVEQRLDSLWGREHAQPAEATSRQGQHGHGAQRVETPPDTPPEGTPSALETEQRA